MAQAEGGRGRALQQLIQGECGHSYAPLSQSQTMAIVQVLEAKIRELKEETTGLRRDFGHMEADATTLRSQQASTSAAVQSLQEARDATSAAFDGLRRDFARSSAKVNKLGSSLEQTQDDGKALRDAARVINTTLQSAKQELSAQGERLSYVQGVVEVKHFPCLTEIRETLVQAQTAIRGLREDGERARAAQQETRDTMRAVSGNVQRIDDDLAKANTFASLLENRMSEAMSSLKAARQQLSETNTVALKIHEDHAHTKAQLAQAQDGAKKLGQCVKGMHERLERAWQRLSDVVDQVSKNTASIGSSRESIDKLMGQVQSLNEAQDALTSMTATLRNNLDETSSMVASVRARLKETNSMVLPNLRLETSRPWSVMTDAPTTPGGSRKSPASARRQSSHKVSSSPAGNQSPGLSLMQSWSLDTDTDALAGALSPAAAPCWDPRSEPS